MKSETNKTVDRPEGFGGAVYSAASGNVGNSKFAIVVSTYHDEITGKLLQGALATLKSEGVTDERIVVYWVPGAWEIPVVAERVIHDFDALIGLGVVIRGETTHDQHINSSVSHCLGGLAIETGKPVAFGLLTCNNIEQAQARSGGAVGNKGCESAAAVIDVLKLFSQIN